MSRDEKIRCGAYVYFTFLRPFADVAGVADQLDWTVPRDIARAVLPGALGMEGDERRLPETRRLLRALSLRRAEREPRRLDRRATSGPPAGPEPLWNES